MILEVGGNPMRASDLTLELLIEKDILKKHNMMINSIDSWGILRRDLINALGVKRAKRFLVRYGWNDGKNEAKMFKEAFVWKDNIEWLIAGTKMHALSGRVISYPETFNVDMEKGEFEVNGYWIDSHEAEQHLTYFSPYSEPICYYLTGYASGYVSECMGKTVIFKEVTCKGKLDSHCSYQGKTLEAWGDEIEDELIYYEDTDLSDELDEMYRRLELQKDTLKIGSQLNRQLTNALLQEAGLDEFAKIYTEITTRPIVIEDNEFNRIAQHSEMPGLNGDFSAAQLKEKLEELVSERQPIIKELPNKTFDLITMPVFIGDELIGYITSIMYRKDEKPISNAMERMAQMTALWMKQERVTIEVEEKLSGNFLDALLTGTKEEKNAVYERFIRIGYDLTKPHYVLNLEIDGNHDDNEERNENNEQEISVIKNGLINFFTNDKKHYDPYAILFSIKKNTIKAVVAEHLLTMKKVTIEQYAEAIFALMKNDKYPVYIGVSTLTSNIDDFSKMMVEAEKAVELAKLQEKGSAITYTNELGHMSLLLNARDPEELKQYAFERLKPLIDYDRENESSLVYTLYNYSQNEFNLHKTARNIHISISGMRYRIQKIEELLDRDLTDSNLRFEIQLALYTLYMLGQIES